jgi:hypothetical protein
MALDPCPGRACVVGLCGKPLMPGVGPGLVASQTQVPGQFPMGQLGGQGYPRAFTPEQ